MQTINKHAVTETVLTCIHNGKFYDSIKPLLANYAAKIVKGKYDATLAVKGIYNTISAFMRSPEWATIQGDWKPTKAERMEVCREILAYYEDEIIDQAETLIGPETLTVSSFDYSHDIYGNPTCHYSVNARRVTSRRIQAGYDSHHFLDGAYTVLSRRQYGEWYELTELTGSRSSGGSTGTYKRKAVTLN